MEIGHRTLVAVEVVFEHLVHKVAFNVERAAHRQVRAFCFDMELRVDHPQAVWIDCNPSSRR
jgi:hypothetical protein